MSLLCPISFYVLPRLAFGITQSLTATAAVLSWYRIPMAAQRIHTYLPRLFNGVF